MQGVPQLGPAGSERDKEKGHVNSDEDPGVIEVLDADVEQFGGRQVGPVGSDFVGLESQDAENEGGTMESNGREDH